MSSLHSMAESASRYNRRSKVQAHTYISQSNGSRLYVFFGFSPPPPLPLPPSPTRSSDHPRTRRLVMGRSWAKVKVKKRKRHLNIMMINELDLLLLQFDTVNIAGWTNPTKAWWCSWRWDGLKARVLGLKTMVRASDDITKNVSLIPLALYEQRPESYPS